MKEAPERIWLLWADGLIENRYQASATDHTEEGGCREFIRLDAHEAAVAAARKEGMLEAAGIVEAQGKWMQDHNLVGNGFDLIQQGKTIRAAAETSK